MVNIDTETSRYNNKDVDYLERIEIAKIQEMNILKDADSIYSKLKSIRNNSIV